MKETTVIGNLTKTTRTRKTKNGDTQAGFEFSGVEMESGRLFSQTFYYSNKLTDLPTGEVSIRLTHREVGDKWGEEEGQVVTKAHVSPSLPSRLSKFQELAFLGRSGLSGEAQKEVVTRAWEGWSFNEVK